MSSLSPNDIILSGSFSGAGKLSLNQYNIITQENQLKRKEQKEKKFDNNILLSIIMLYPFIMKIIQLFIEQILN